MLVAFIRHSIAYMHLLYLPLVSSSMDPLQFAYQPGIGVDDAVIDLLHRSLSHLEKPGSSVRVMFFDLCSAFNTIQSGLLRNKLENTGGSPPIKLDSGLPHHPTTVCEDTGLCV